MSPTYDIVPHRLIPGVSGVGDAENLTWTNNNAGGYGSAEWDQRSDPPAKGDEITIVSEGVHVFEGKVASVSGGVGERLSYHVTCYGRADELKINEAYAGIFVDRDLAQWRLADCANWSAAPDFQINVLADNNRLTFSWPETDKLIVDRSDADDFIETTGDGTISAVGPGHATHYVHVGNSLPHWSRADFAAPKVLWSAACYQIGDGASTNKITGLSFDALWNLNTPKLDAKKTPDYTSPIGPPDEKHGHRFSVYPKINYWTGFYGLSEPPENCFLGVYVCDAVSDLPVTNPLAMRTDPHLLHRFDARTKLSNVPSIGPRKPGQDRGDRSADDEVAAIKLRFPCEGKVVVFYATYLPVQLPMNLGHRYSKNADHLVRTEWVAVNRIYSEPGQYVEIRNLSVYSQGYESQADGSDDLADVFRIVFPTCECAAMPLPAAVGDNAPTSIVIRERKTQLAAITELLALYPMEMCWGVWEDGVLKIEHDSGSVSLGDEPGVDTSGAAQTDEGAVDLVLVSFVPKSEDAGVGELVLNSVALLLVDKDGAVTYPGDDWAPAAGVRVGFIDASGQASSEIAAARIGQMEAITRRPGKWAGQVVARGIAGASAFRPGKTLDAPGVAGALITGATVAVDSDTVTFALGSSGYRFRFPERVPGRPLTAAPPGISTAAQSRRNLRG